MESDMPRRSLKDLTTSELEKVYDRWFSIFIRLRDADDNGYVVCCTCWKIKKWNRGMDCGHYSKRNKAHRFNPDNCHAQCKYCNKWLKGDADNHARYIDKRYGEGTAKELRDSENIQIDRPREWYLQKIEAIKPRVKRLIQQKDYRE